jgi:hypothetical protein
MTTESNNVPEPDPQLFGFPLSVDVLVATPADLRTHKDHIGLVYHRALREGKEIYAA